MTNAVAPRLMGADGVSICYGARMSRLLPFFVVVFSLLSVSGCNDHVFTLVETVCSPTDTPKEEQAEDVPADILLVVDNSGSMCAEQDNLVANFFRDDCEIEDLNNIPQELKNPTPEKVAELSRTCGFIQILALYDNDFRIGVTSTDVSGCDNRQGWANIDDEDDPNFCKLNVEPWGRNPQRGCLQAPEGADKKFIENGDENIQETFAGMIGRLQTHGSPFERGLDAMRLVLDPDAEGKDPACEDDGRDFLRDDARLVVIFVSDEDDCSHADGAYGFTNDAGNDTCMDTDPYYYANEDGIQVRPSACYAGTADDQHAALAPVSDYIDFLNELKGPDKVSVAVIAGGTLADDGEVLIGGCSVGDDGRPAGGCRESRGLSNYSKQPGDPCHVDHPDGACCDADPGTRYFQFADGMNDALKDSICQASFGPTMINIAKFIAAKAQFTLGEGTNTDGLTVYICNADAPSIEDCVFAQRIPPGEDPVGRSGWQLSGSRTINLYGTAVLQPGQEVRIFALADDDRECAAWARQDPPETPSEPEPNTDGGT